MWRGSRDDMEKKKLRDRSYREGRASAIRVAQNSTSTNKAMDVINAFTKEYETTIFDDQLSSGFEQAAIIARKYYDKFKRLLTP